MIHIWPLPSVRIGEGCISDLQEVFKELEAKVVLVVTDKGIIKAGLYEHLKKILDQTGISTHLIDDVQADPSIELVDEISVKAKKEKADAIIGLGGGSSIDSAKVAAALAGTNESVRQYIGVGKLEKPGLPIIAIPTTAGTGSEVTYLSILSDLANETKKAFGTKYIIPKYAFLDPEFMKSLPKHITATTGMDALCHAVEAYTSSNATSYSDALAEKAIELIGKNLVKTFNDGKDMKTRKSMMLASHMAGIAFANAGVTAVHAFAYPLGGMFHVPHGMANSLMLPVIIKYNASSKKDRFGKVAELLTGGKDANWEKCISEIENLSEELELPRNLKEYGIPESAIKSMSVSVMDQTRLLVNNPRKITQEDAFSIYSEAYSR